jgi:hypothetical protein
MPTAEQLLPPIRKMQLRGGEVVMLEDPGTVTPSGECNAVVTVERNGVTESLLDCHACTVCGNTIAAGKGLYCSNACRQSAYRRRHGVVG